MNISSLKYHLSVIEEQKTVLPFVNVIRGERDCGRWDLMLREKMLLFLTTNMVAETSRAIQQLEVIPHG